MQDAQNKPVEESPLVGLLSGIAAVAGTVYVSVQPNAFENQKPLWPWVVGFFFLAGVWWTFSNGLKLYGMKVRKLDSNEADLWSGEAIFAGIFGIIKWGFIAGAVFAVYVFFSGDDWNSFSPADRLIVGLLIFVGYMLFLVGKQLDEIHKTLRKRP